MEEQCRQEMEKHKQMLDREYEQLLTQFSRELERLQLKHQEELGKRVIINLRYDLVYDLQNPFNEYLLIYSSIFV